MAYRGSFGFGMHLTPWVKNLLIANAAVFVVMMVLPVTAQRAMMLELAFVPAWALMRPWTAVTYMFVHGGFMHLFFNMLGLFFFGPALEQRWGSAQFLKFYFFCGIGGAAFSFLFASMNPVVGASAAVYGIMLAFALNWPDMPIYIWGVLPIPAKYLVGILAVFSLMSALGGAGGNVAHFAHLGGFAFGYLYLRMMGRRSGGGWDVGAGGRAGKDKGGAFDGLRRMMTKRRMTVVRGDDEPAASRRGEPPAPSKPTAEPRPDPRLLDELDRVLDKISTEGMSSLTPRERRLLDEVSRKYRQN
jgi:membrane associated rhomboid family serine protease